MSDNMLREKIARVLEPQAWAALGTGDTLAYRSRRTSSERKADRILALPEIAEAFRAQELYEDACSAAQDRDTLD